MNKVRTISRIQCENLKFIGIFLSLTCSSSILLMPSSTLSLCLLAGVGAGSVDFSHFCVYLLKTGRI